MIEPHAADVLSYIQDEGVSLDDLKVQSHSFDVNQLINSKIDAITAYKTDEPYVLEQSNFEYSVISPLSGGIDFYGDILFTSEHLISESPDLVDQFRKASIKGWKYAMDNPEELIEVIFNKYSKRHTKAHLRFEADKMKHYIMHDVVEIGYSNRGRWDNIIATYRKLGFVGEGLTSEGMLYSDYLEPEIHIPWILIGSVLLIFVLIGFVASFYFGLSRNFKKEITRRKEAQRVGKVGHWEYNIIKNKLYWSDQTYQIYEVSPEDFECTYENAIKLFHQEDRQLVIDKYLDYSTDNQKMEITHRIISESGKLKYITQRTETSFDEKGNPLSTIGSVQDITESKLAENLLFEQKKQLQELNATKDKFFSIIGHDLRSPFAGIIGFSDFLLKNLKILSVAETDKYVGVINSSVKNTLDLLDNLLLWSKSQTGKISFSPKKIVLASIIREVITASNSIAKIKNISLNLNKADEFDVYADENMLLIILRNLISNAIKFTEMGGHVNISLRSIDKQVEITISDDGVGMSDEIRESLFDISSNVTTIGTADEKGSGLGLVLCKEFVLKHGGSIWVESEEGKGSDFKFTLPLNE